MKNLFDTSKCATDKKLHNFPKYVRRQSIARFLVQYELFKKQLNVKGSVVECGVHNGGGVMAWAKISTTLEPYNYRRHIFGFDTFEGFPTVHAKDGKEKIVKKGSFAEEDYNIYEELKEVVAQYDADRFINQIDKVRLIKGDANKTIPKFLKDSPHVLVSLLYLDFDIYEPTVTALKHFIPRMPRGAIIAFDEVNNEHWPGETRALLENLNIGDYKLECFDFEPNISYIQL